MVVLLPEGRAIANPESIKLVKIIASEINKKKSFVVVVKIVGSKLGLQVVAVVSGGCWLGLLL